MPLKGNVPKNTEKKKMFWWVGGCQKISVLFLVVKFVTGDYGSEGLSSEGLLKGTFLLHTSQYLTVISQTAILQRSSVQDISGL